MDQHEFRLFALDASRGFGTRVAERLGIALASHEEREFEGGEHKARPLVNVRGRDVYVVQSLDGDETASANDKLCRLLFFIGALKDASAGKVTAVVPYLCYSRKDRKTQPRDPVITRYVAQLFEAVGTDRVVAFDVHNIAAFQNAFRCPTDHLEALGLFADHFKSRLPSGDVVVLSPDIGGMKRAEALREALARATGRVISIGFMEKQRIRGEVTGEALFAEVAGRSVVIIDDMISSGTTIARAARACRKQGAARIYVGATHGAFTAKANETLADLALEQIAVTDSIACSELAAGPVRDKLVTLDSSGLFAEAIRRIHEGGSLAELLAVP
ncbi:MAG TPA: ribose-phosphate pyrophosphokinase [Candidatus Udaeobacter sp.]|nr:ribose-phosphate pyrophosphokinase [Candidatus Udaeobacter sp.]